MEAKLRKDLIKRGQRIIVERKEAPKSAMIEKHEGEMCSHNWKEPCFLIKNVTLERCIL